MNRVDVTPEAFQTCMMLLAEFDGDTTALLAAARAGRKGAGGPRVERITATEALQLYQEKVITKAELRTMLGQRGRAAA